MLRTAFNLLARLHSREATLKRYGATDVDNQESIIRILPSRDNYFHDLPGPSQTVIRVREMIIPVDSIQSPFTPMIKRGDKIIDTVLGTLAINQVTEMVDVGGAIMGFRCRVE